MSPLGKKEGELPPLLAVGVFVLLSPFFHLPLAPGAEKGVVSVPARLVDHFPCKVTSVLKQWTQVTHAAVEGHPSYREMEELGLVQGSELVYQAVLRRGSAMVRALVLLGANYPQEAPLFLLTLQLREEQSSRDDDAVKELERELNVHSVEQGQGAACGVGEHLLTYQLQQLLVCMDVLLESLCEAHQDAPREFSRDKVLARAARYRTPFIRFAVAGEDLLTKQR